MPEEPDTAAAPLQDTEAAHPDIHPERVRLMRLLTSRRVHSHRDEVPEVSPPITEREAKAFAEREVGLERNTSRLGWCWYRLPLSSTPEQRLSYQRLITALAIAIGMERHEAGANLCAMNQERNNLQQIESAESSALARWSRLGPGLNAEAIV